MRGRYNLAVEDSNIYLFIGTYEKKVTHYKDFIDDVQYFFHPDNNKVITKYGEVESSEFFSICNKPIKISKETFDALSESLLKIKKLTDMTLLTANTLINKNNNKSNNN